MVRKSRPACQSRTHSPWEAALVPPIAKNARGARRHTHYTHAGARDRVAPDDCRTQVGMSETWVASYCYSLSFDFGGPLSGWDEGTS